MTELTRSKANLDFLISEASGHRSRDNIVVGSGAGVLAAGTIIGAKSTGKYFASTVAVLDGAETATAVLAYAVDATSADVSTVAITRDAEVNINQLVYASDADLDAEKLAKRTQLAAVGIIAR